MASKYRQRVLVGTDESSKPIYQWACGNTQHELNQRIAELLDAPKKQTKTENCPLWEEYATRWFNTHKTHLRPNTADRQEYFFNRHVKSMFAGKRLDEINTFDIMDELSKHKGYVKSHGRDLLGMLRNIFFSAVEDRHIHLDKNPINSKRIKNPCTRKSTPRKALSRSEQVDIIAHLQDLKNPSDRRFMSFLMFTCLSPSEIYGLRWEDIDVENGFIRVERALTFSKGKGILGDTKEDTRTRSIPIDPQLLEHIAPMQKAGVIVCRIGRGHDGEYYTEQAHKCGWKRIKEQIDVHDMTPYTGRHTYATNMSKAGVPMRTAITIMGHADERMINRVYQHTDTEDLKHAGTIMSDFIGNIQSA